MSHEERHKRIAEIRRRIHEIYEMPSGRETHGREIEALSAELSELLAERPEVINER